MGVWPSSCVTLKPWQYLIRLSLSLSSIKPVTPLSFVVHRGHRLFSTHGAVPHVLRCSLNTTDVINSCLLASRKWDILVSQRRVRSRGDALLHITPFYRLLIYILSLYRQDVMLSSYLIHSVIVAVIITVLQPSYSTLRGVIKGLMLPVQLCLIKGGKGRQVLCLGE